MLKTTSSQWVARIVLLALTGLACGCDAWGSPAKYVKPLRLDANDDRPVALQSNVNRRFVYVVKANGNDTNGRKYYVYAEPPPDTALTSTTDIAASLKLPETAEVAGQLKLATAIVDLTKRTQTIVLLRDTLFRLAEARANGFITEQTYQERMKELTDAAFDIASGQADAIAETGRSVSELSSAVTASATQTDPEKNLANPPGLDKASLDATLETIKQLNQTLQQRMNK